MCRIASHPLTLHLAAGPHTLVVEVVSRGGLAHKSAYFEIDFVLDETCLPAPTPTPTAVPTPVHTPVPTPAPTLAAS